MAPTPALYICETVELELSLATVSIETDESLTDYFSCPLRLTRGTADACFTCIWLWFHCLTDGDLWNCSLLTFEVCSYRSSMYRTLSLLSCSWSAFTSSAVDTEVSAFLWIRYFTLSDRSSDIQSVCWWLVLCVSLSFHVKLIPLCLQSVKQQIRSARIFFPAHLQSSEGW